MWFQQFICEVKDRFPMSDNLGNLLLVKRPGPGGVMKTKEEIVTNWLPRYTGTPLKNFGKYILRPTSMIT